MNLEDNSSLIEQLIEGKEEAYIYLVDTYHRKLFAYALSLTNDHYKAQDIVQEVFLRTWKYRKSLNTNYSINGFLHKAIYNEFVNQYHKNRPLISLEKFYIEELNEITEDANINALETKIALITAEIEKLPPKCKKTFLLSKSEGLTNNEIAEYLNLSIKTVEAHISKAYSIIRKKLKGKMSTFLFINFFH